MPEQKHPGADAFLREQVAKYAAGKEARISKLIAAIRTDEPRGAITLLQEEINSLDRQATLAGLSGARPIFGAFQELFTSLPGSAEVDWQELATVLSGLSDSLRHILILRGDKAAMADELLQRCRSLVERYRTTPDIDLTPKEFALPAEGLDQYIAEGKTLLDELSRSLAALGREGALTDALAGVLRAAQNLIGNADLLVAAVDAEPPHDHPLRGFRELLGYLESFAHRIADQTTPLTEQQMQRFGPLMQALNGLHADLEQGRPTPLDAEIVVTAADALTDPLAGLAPFGEIQPPPTEGAAAAQSAPSAPKAQEGESSFIQVRLDRIDYLTRLVGELVVARSSLTHLQSLLASGEDHAVVADAMARSEKTFGHTITELEDLVLGVRMRRIGELFGRFPRMVRDLAKKSNKRINLVLEGEDTELDNTILQAVSDPLMHLVRNACDHGCETPAERESRGKHPVGHLVLAAKVAGGNVCIEIQDDGRGIDPVLLRQKAVEKRILSAVDAEALDDQAARNLIFTPAFSTATEVTDVSGRGVGMDVVRHNLAEVNGEIELESEVGRGTRVRLILPVAMSIARGLKVIVAGRRFLIPLTDVINMVHVATERIHTYGTSYLLSLKDTTMVVIPLACSLGLQEPQQAMESDAWTIVVLQVREQLIGAVVDDIQDIEDIAVRPLPGSMERLPYYGGCSILADGLVVPVLDVKALFESVDNGVVSATPQAAAAAA